MLFKDAEHEKFYNSEYSKTEKFGVYAQAVVYLCGICPETRHNFPSMFNLNERTFDPCLHASWQTSSTRKLSSLAFNLWNGAGNGDPEEPISPEFLPNSVFACNLAPYFLQAIQLRFPEYF